MNLPVGEAVARMVSFDESRADERIAQLLNAGFSGYVVATAEGLAGIEEAVLLIRGNAVIGAIFEAVKSGAIFFGLDALRLSLNLLKAKKGVFDVNALSSQQIDLIIAFNEKVQLLQPVDMQTFGRLLPAEYRPQLVHDVLHGSQGPADDKEKVLKRFGLGSI